MAMGDHRYMPGDVYSWDGTPLGIVTSTPLAGTIYDVKSEHETHSYVLGFDLAPGYDHNATRMYTPDESGIQIMMEGTFNVTLPGVQDVQAGSPVYCNEDGKLEFLDDSQDVQIGVVLGVLTEVSSGEEGSTCITVRLSPQMNERVEIPEEDIDTVLLQHFDAATGDFLTIFDNGDFVGGSEWFGGWLHFGATGNGTQEPNNGGDAFPEREIPLSDLMMQDFSDD